MYIGPIQQTNTNSLNRVNFKQVTVEYRDIDDKRWRAIDRKVKRTLKPIMYKLEKLSEGHDVLLNVTYISPPPIRPGETFEPERNVVEIIIDNNREKAENVLIKRYNLKTVFPKSGGWEMITTDVHNVPVKVLRENILDTLQSMLDNNQEKAKNVLRKQYQTEDVFPKEGGWDRIKTDVYNVLVKTLRENILNTLQSMLKGRK